MICEFTITNASGGITSKVASGDLAEIKGVIREFFGDFGNTSGGDVATWRASCSCGGGIGLLQQSLEPVDNDKGSVGVLHATISGERVDAGGVEDSGERSNRTGFGVTCVEETTSGGLHGSERVPGFVVRGPNYDRNRAKRLARKEREAGRLKEAKRSLHESWILRNKLETIKLTEQIKVAESSAGNPRLLQSKVKTREELDLESAERVDRLKKIIAKHKADELYWKKRQESGAVDKAIAVENEILDGQLSGKYDPFACRRTIGWAKTVRIRSSGSGSGSGKPSVWSGSGATSKSNLTSGDKKIGSVGKDSRSDFSEELKLSEQKIAVYEEKLRKAEKEIVDVRSKADKLNKQLITVTVESDRKSRELFELEKFKGYLEKAKKERQRRADNEFETFRTQADCSY